MLNSLLFTFECVTTTQSLYDNSPLFNVYKSIKLKIKLNDYQTDDDGHKSTYA